jgi:hypothetical protein
VSSGCDLPLDSSWVRAIYKVQEKAEMVPAHGEPEMGGPDLPVLRVWGMGRVVGNKYPILSVAAAATFGV